MKFEIESVSTRKKKKKKREEQRLYIILIAFFSLASIMLLTTFLILQHGNKTKRIPVNQQQPVEIPKKKELTIFNEKSDDRPIAVMVDNAIGDAKHSGLQESYLNYEIIVEGGLTRIMAIYKDKNATLVGPIRSARHYFLDYALENDAIYVHYGWSPYAEQDIKKLSVNNINGITDSNPFRRDTKLKSPHNVFSRLDYIKEYSSQKNYNETSNNWKLFEYSAEEKNLDTTEFVPKVASKIELTYSNSEYRSYSYDSENKYYLRSQNGRAHLDNATNNQLHYKNIIIQRVENTTKDTEGRQELETVGSGKGYFITNGYYLPINWKKDSREEKTRYYYENNEEITLNDGNTFIQIVPIDSKITIE